MPVGSPLLAEIREFLAGLRRELPRVFSPAPSPQRRRKEEQRPPRSTVFEDRAAHWSRAMGVRHGRIRVKDQKSLWGSCTARGELNFNRRLLMAPPEVLDYVVVHELSHLLVRGHSARFWEQVSRWCPDHRRHRRWLRENGPGLMRRRDGDAAAPCVAELRGYVGIVGQAVPS